MKKENDFYYWFEERLAYSRIKHSFHTWKNLNAAYRKMKAFRPSLSVTDINYKLLKDLELYLIKSGLSTNTIHEHLIRVKVIVNELVRSGHIEYHKNPFLNFHIDTARVHKKRIPISDVQILENADLSSQPNIELARDMYIFSFYCAGIRFGDLCRLKKEMVKNGYLNYTMHKTGKLRHIKLMGPAVRIAFKHEGEFIFSTKVNWDYECKSISSRNALFNKWLKRACGKCGITELNYHTSRNCFADHAKKMNIDVHTIKDLLGHSNVKTTEIYMKDFYEEQTEHAFIRMFG